MLEIPATRPGSFYPSGKRFDHQTFLFHTDRDRGVGAESCLCQQVAVQAQGQSESFSTFFSTGGNVSITAGEQAHNNRKRFFNAGWL